MQKAHIFYKKGLANGRFNRIVPQATPKNQEFRFIKLSKYIQRHELTNALEILAQSGIEGDLAVFAIGNLQDLMRGGEV